ncbi:MAG: ABC transporter ATP-binding protein [Planctomycetota bacterium]|nr:MAG: ABC transporter ATP-binding protein [Planctomycetota bacterium]
MTSSSPLLQVRDLEVVYASSSGRRQVRALAGIDLQVQTQECMGLVGESGCGKSTLAKCLLGLVPAQQGSIKLSLPAEFRTRFPDLEQLWQSRSGSKTDPGLELIGLSGKAWRAVRKAMGFVFQDPLASLDPRMRAWQIVTEPLAMHGLASGKALRKKADQLLDLVGLDTQVALRYPRQFSGGQRQRLGIARALALEPPLVICDEAVSALDVSVQAQILTLLRELQQSRGTSFVFISHDLSVVKQIAQRTAVMYLGRIVEEGPSQDLFEDPWHPYSRALLEAVPQPQVAGRERQWLVAGEAPSPANPPSGCSFHPRCPLAEDQCRRQFPPMIAATAPSRQAACFQLSSGEISQ